MYRGRVRDGKFGTLTAEEYEVWELSERRLGFLHPFPVVDYADASYRTAVNESASIEQYFKLHADQQPGYLNLLRPYLTRGMTVADCGCGGGALLDLVKTETGGRTVAIEPFSGYHASLHSRGHEAFSTAEAASSAGKTDVALSIHVIEHVENPVEYLAGIRRLVRSGGRAVILTPNWDDILLSIDRSRMESFFYRRVHNYYFAARSLNWVAKMAGWRIVTELYYHEFGLANALLWLRDGRPSGHTVLTGITAEADAFWKSYLERLGRANQVGVVLENADPTPAAHATR